VTFDLRNAPRLSDRGGSQRRRGVMEESLSIRNRIDSKKQLVRRNRARGVRTEPKSRGKESGGTGKTTGTDVYGDGNPPCRSTPEKQ